MPELQERYDKLLEGAEKGWRPEDGDFERVLTELVGFGKRELLGETGRIGEWCSCTLDEARPASSSLTFLRLDLQGRRSEDQSRSIRSVDADCPSTPCKVTSPYGRFLFGLSRAERAAESRGTGYLTSAIPRVRRALRLRFSSRPKRPLARDEHDFTGEMLVSSEEQARVGRHTIVPRFIAGFYQ